MLYFFIILKYTSLSNHGVKVLTLVLFFLISLTTYNVYVLEYILYSA